jgi:hypothetical protein
MLTEKQRELVENIWRYDCGQLFDSIHEGTNHMDIEGMCGWVFVEDWIGGSINSVQTAKSVLGSLVKEGYIFITFDEPDNSYHFTEKLADVWGMTRYESYCKYRIG